MAKEKTTPGERLKAARLAAGLTQVQAAAAAGVYKQDWYAIENDLRAASLERLREFALAIGADPHEIHPHLASVPVPKPTKTGARK